MKSLFVASVAALAFVFTAAAADERAKIVSTIDEFCSWTGMKRISELRDIGHWKTLHDTGGNARFDLLVDGKRTKYRLIFFWQHGRVKIYSIGMANLAAGHQFRLRWSQGLRASSFSWVSSS